ncbi:alpha-1-macroglobulin-like, partial [Scleropages formosus]
VSLEFSPPRAVPAEQGTLKVTAQPGALCGLSSVDQSVLLLEPNKQLDADKVCHSAIQLEASPGQRYSHRCRFLPLRPCVHSSLKRGSGILWKWAPSSDYKLEPHPGSQYSSCLCASETKTFQWGLVASALGAVNVTVSAEAVPSQTECDNEVVSVPEKGRIDRVTRALLVKAEGMEKTDSHSWLLCPKGEEIKEEVKLELPENVVEGSARGSSFVKAQAFVFIDPTIVEQAQTWLLKNQKPDGCFNTVGKLFNNRMKGGVADDVTLTAYITAAFLESKTSVSALGGLLHWSQSTTEMTLSVEISSYVLLAVLNKSPLTAEDMGYAVRIGSSTVTVQSTSGEQHRFLVDQGNRLLYQERALKDVTGQYSIAVQGTSCASVQTTLRYNIPTPAVNSTFSVAINVSSECKGVPRGEKVILKFSVEYNGLLESTNMVLVDIKVLSGFVPDPLSLTQLKRSELVERVDSKGDHIEMYLKELTRNIPKFYKLQLQQELKVKNLKAAVIKMYDYYQP